MWNVEHFRKLWALSKALLRDQNLRGVLLWNNNCLVSSTCQVKKQLSESLSWTKKISTKNCTRGVTALRRPRRESLPSRSPFWYGSRYALESRRGRGRARGLIGGPGDRLVWPEEGATMEERTGETTGLGPGWRLQRRKPGAGVGAGGAAGSGSEPEFGTIAAAGTGGR